MNAASVGFQCPTCVSAGRASGRAPRTAFGANLSSGDGTATKAIMGTLALVYLLDLLSRGRVLGLLALSNSSVSAGQFWRLLTYGFTSIGLFGLAMNLLVLWLAGRALESELGRWRFLALYLVVGLGGATLFFAVGPDGAFAVGASAAVIGLLSANAIAKHRSREDIRPDIGLLVVIVLYNVALGFTSFGWLGLIGGILVGAVAGVIFVHAPRERRTPVQVVGLLGVVLVCLLVVVAKMALI